MKRLALDFLNLFAKKKQPDRTSNNETETEVANETLISNYSLKYKLEEILENRLTVSVAKVQTISQKMSQNHPKSKESNNKSCKDMQSRAVLDIIHIPTWFSLKNKYIVEYCIELLNDHEQFSNKLINTEKQLIKANRFDKSNHKSLADVLSSFDAVLRLEESWRLMKEASTDGINPFSYYVDKLVQVKKIREKNRFIKDSEMFFQIYQSRSGDIEPLLDKSYWGSRQQLLSGKVIADFVAEHYGSLDPVFGVLLNPTTGRVGPGDGGLMHNILFDNDGPWACHTAVHDAFGYLKTFHNIGPGYNYLGGISAFETEHCMAGQSCGLLFWKETLIKVKELNM
ncbi:uncharacterized protein LOC124814843 [Hydra vulgaris]|uniref:Uncharacterized protein LOC124814843 n=1 Tax=Hydra vulgaris TaxID=6087 RepID=A0ABM4BYS2_HYDVU